MLPLKPGGPGDHVRPRLKLQAVQGAGQHKVHVLQLLPLRFQADPLFPQQLQRFGGVLSLETAADLLQGCARLAEDGDGVKIVELLHVVVKIAVVPLVGWEEQSHVFVVAQSFLGCTAQGGEGPGGQPSFFSLHKNFLQELKIPLDCVAATRFMIPPVRNNCKSTGQQYEKTGGF